MGFGFLESMYSAAMTLALLDEGLPVEREVPIAAYFRGIRIGSFRADLVVSRVVLVEIKATPLCRRLPNSSFSTTCGSAAQK